MNKNELRQDTAPEKRAELHLHTNMSAMDAASDVGEVIEQAIRWGHDAVAVTDHGGVWAFPEAERAAGDRIKLIYGMEGYLSGDLSGQDKPYHVTLLARSQSGLKNLYRLISDSNLKHFRRVPRILKSELSAHRDGLLIGSACLEGELFQAVTAHRDWEELKRVASFYDYLELQPLCGYAPLLQNGAVRDEEEVRELCRAVIRLGEELGKPVCATGDVHFLEPEDEVCRRILLNAKKHSDADKPQPLYFRTTGEMLAEFSWLGEEKAYEVVVANTRKIADRVEPFHLLPEGLRLPRLKDSEEDWKRTVWERAHRLYGENLPEPVENRLHAELDIIRGQYDVIYMAAQKLAKRSAEHGYPVSFRGAVGSSLIAFLAGITEVNPLPPHYRCANCGHTEFITELGAGCGADLPDKNCPACGGKYVKDGFNIPYETFLGFGGGKLPDIDLNFSGEYLPEAHRHAEELFGKDHVFRAGTIGTMRQRTAERFVRDYVQERNLPADQTETERLTGKLCGVRRTTGQHPGGLVIVPDDLCMEDFCPVQHPADDCRSETVTTQFEYRALEGHLLKMDLLGHDGPTMLHDLRELTGTDPHDIPLDDPETLSIFTSSKALGYENDEILGPVGTVAVPEFGTRSIRQMLAEAQPKSLEALVRLLSLAHGTGTWQGNARELLLSAQTSIQEVASCRDDVMQYLISKGLKTETSYQIMEAVRKGYARKRGFSKLRVDAMQECSVPEWYIESLRKIGYLFPRAHAAAYVVTAFRIAWFKVHDPQAFYTAYFTVYARGFDAEICRAGVDALKREIWEIERNPNASAAERDRLMTLEVCYELFLRGLHFEFANEDSPAASKFRIVKSGPLPPR